MKNDELKNTWANNIDFIKQADAKAAFISSALFILIGILVQKSAIFTDKTWSLLVYIGLFVLAGVVIALLTRSIFPVLKNADTKRSHIYFGSIASMSLKEFEEDIKKVRGKTYSEELIRQVYVTSKIASKKMSGIKWSFAIFILFAALSMISAVLAKYH